MEQCRSKRVLSVGDKFKRGRVAKIHLLTENVSDGFVVRLRFKRKMDREVLVSIV